MSTRLTRLQFIATTADEEEVGTDSGVHLCY